MKQTLKKLCVVLFGSCFVLASGSGPAYAEEASYAISMSPMNENIVLVAGEKYYGSFSVNAPASNDSDLPYEVSVQPFYVDENYNVYYHENEGYNQIVEWITVDDTDGVLAPNTGETIHYTVDVPKDAPAGGQYVAIVASSKADDSGVGGGGTGLNINQNVAVSHIIYAEIAGTTEYGGEIMDANVPSFLFSGNITASSSIKNTGNVHNKAKYTLQIFPLFSGEEVYTNEEDPVYKTILPDRTLYHEIVWDQTPAVGIFNVIYTVEFEGMTTQVKKMVIKCPIWLLFIIIFAIIALIIWVVLRMRARKDSRARSAGSASTGDAE